MPVQEFALDSAGEQRVQIFRNSEGDGSPTLTVLLDRHIIGSLSTKEELAMGKTFPLPDGSVLAVRFVNNQPQVLRNGQPLLPPPATTTSRLEPVRSRRERGGCLTAWLILMLLGAGGAMYESLSTYQDLEVHGDPNLLHWPFLVVGLLNLCTFAGVFALFSWRKWGAFLGLLSAIAALVLIFSLGLPITWEQVVGPIVTYLVLFSLLQSNDRWSMFKWW